MLIVAQIVVRKTPRFLSSVTRTYSKKTPKPWWDDRQSKITGGGHHRPGGGGGYRGTLKGHGPDTSSVQISKTISRILRHDAKSLGIPMRSDGYVRVQDLLRQPLLGNVDFPTLASIVKKDNKQRFHLVCEGGMGVGGGAVDAGVWWICANQGHTIVELQMDMKRITAEDIPMAVHGTSEQAWKSISVQGLSKMNRNHIHLAQGVAGEGVISGMRSSSRILIYIDVEAAIAADIKFYLSRNGVVLTPGDDLGYIPPNFFRRVERVRKETTTIPGWEGAGALDVDAVTEAPRSKGIAEHRSTTSVEAPSVVESDNDESPKWKKPPHDELTLV